MWIICAIILLVVIITLIKLIDKKYRKKICLIGLGIIILGCVSWIAIFFLKPPIGEISGPEFDIITIKGTVYEQIYDNKYSNSDKGKYLGKVETEDSKVTFRVY